ncbi:hypothetical protein MTR67_006714, partial [Solanum verrucosum]
DRHDQQSEGHCSHSLSIKSIFFLLILDRLFVTTIPPSLRRIWKHRHINSCRSFSLCIGMEPL